MTSTFIIGRFKQAFRLKDFPLPAKPIIFNPKKEVFVIEVKEVLAYSEVPSDDDRYMLYRGAVFYSLRKMKTGLARTKDPYLQKAYHIAKNYLLRHEKKMYGKSKTNDEFDDLYDHYYPCYEP